MDDNMDDIISRYLKGKANPEEVRRVEAYYASFSDKSNYIDSLSDKEKKLLEDKILKDVYAKIYRKAESKKSISIKFPSLLKIAASLAGLIILSFAYKFFISPGTTVLETQYGEVVSYVLPDSSTVTLNGNSSLAYESWDDASPRVVTLKGEAYFSVTHKANNQKFIVEVPGKYSVEVLGTEFNISERENNSRVVLNSGKVKLNLNENSAEDIIMKPGEMVEFQAAENIHKTIVNTAVYSAWKDHKLIFDNTSLKEIKTILEETYGFKVKVGNKRLLQQTFTGAVPNENIEMLLIGLSKSTDLKVVRNGNYIEINK